ncbi:MAG: S9 family peptidase [Planctomycetota bacterium]
MHLPRTFALLLAAAALAACQNPAHRSGAAATAIPEPVADVRPTKLEKHGHVRVDDYYWLRDREDPEVIAYLEAENAYTDAVMADTEELQQELYDEMIARLVQDDASVPYEEDGWWYYTRFVEGGEYPLYCRKPSYDSDEEMVLLDGNALAQGHTYFAIDETQVSPDDRLLAYSVDTVGRRKYDIHFRAIRTRQLVPDVIPETTGNMVWGDEGRTLYYSKQDPDTLRAYQIWKHVMGTDVAKDELVFQEDDDTFRCFVTKTKSKRFILIVSSHSTTTEWRFLDTQAPEEGFHVLWPRRKGLRYGVEHFGDHFYVWSNDGAPNGKLVRVPIDSYATAKPEVVVAHRDDALLEDFEVFEKYLVLSERVDGLQGVRIVPWDGSPEHSITFDEPTYSVNTTDNHSFATTTLRFVYTSLTTPRSTYDYDMASHERVLRKQDEVLGGFDPANYASERRWAVARDGTRVPISIVYRKGLVRDGSAPLLLYAYGSYGSSTDAYFSSARLSLLDRGFVYAIAHVRGGREMGERWYDQGKLFHKKNTFTDFVDCAEFLVSERFTSPEHLYALGGSAGGLLMGAILNMRPDLFNGVIAAVPFVDVVTTMLDDTIPLTTFEYDEWGNPNEPAYYDYMLSYSPYDQVEAKAYPNLLVTTGLHDSQVQYWEPAKWVAKLRAKRTNDAELLLETNMDAGHGGASGRFQRYQEVALEYAFLLDLEGIEK